MNKVLEVKNITKSYGTKVLDNVTFNLEKGTTLGLVGESGSGKTTICKIITNILEPDSGRVLIKCTENKNNKLLSKKIQMVFQNPYSALNPAFTIRQILVENLIVHRVKMFRKEEETKINDMLSVVSLSTDCLDKYPHELSGGELQRINIARALLLNPEIIILDEVTSQLDATIQKDILDLLKKIQKQFNVSYLIVSHNMNVIQYMSDYIVILRDGKVVECNDTEKIFKNPQEKYTKKILSQSII